MYQLILGLALLLTPRLASAITILPPCTASGDCGLSDLLGVGINFAEFLLGISGAVALGFFVWGGFQMVLAAGNAKKVSEGFETLRNAVIGIVIIFMSGVLVRFTTSALTGQGNTCFMGDATSGKCLPVVGNACTNVGADGSPALWVQIPGGIMDGKPVSDSLECVNDCGDLKSLLEERGRPDAADYGCFATDNKNVTSCVRGLCAKSGPGFACCACPGGGCAAPSK